jgi:hypothetical protein
MMKRIDRTSLRAAATVVFLLLAGALIGIVVDRHWISPPAIEATPLTAESIAARLGLAPTEEARLSALLDTLHVEMMRRLREDPDALGPAVHDAQRRIEAVLPPGTRPEFRALMQEHHEQMMRHTHGGPMDHSHQRRMHGSGP